MQDVDTSIRVALLRREQIATGTVAFHFRKPPGFVFKPGQAVDVVLPAPPGAGGEPMRHAFSIASAPYDDHLAIATRMRDSAYKLALGALAPGDAVGLEGPFGSLTLPRDPGRDAVLIAGGIGITPFMSMLRQAVHDGSRRRLALLYSNRRPEDAAYLEVLERLAMGNERFRLLATMTDMPRSAPRWQGATGFIDADLIAAAASSLRSPIHYLAGPPAMVAGIRVVLAGAGMDDEDVRSEEFFGY